MKRLGTVLLILGIITMLVEFIAGGVITGIGLFLIYLSNKNTSTENKTYEYKQRRNMDAYFSNIDRANFEQHMADSLQIINSTKNIDTMISRYDFAIKRVNDKHHTFTIDDKQSLLNQIEAAADAALDRIFTVEIEDRIDEALRLKTVTGQQNRLHKILTELKSSYKKGTKKFTQINLKEKYELRVKRISEILEKLG